MRNLLADFGADLRFAFRQMLSNPGFTSIAVSALALGIGANIAIFTVVNAVMLNPLPYPQPDRLMRVMRQFAQGTGESVSVPKYMVWRDNQAFQAMTLYTFGSMGMNLGTSDPPDQIKSMQVSADYFKVFGIVPMLGRGFTHDEDLPKGPRAVILTHSLWRSRFAADRNMVGRPIQLNGASYLVVGVLPADFHPDPDADVFTPLQADPASTNQGHYLNVTGRLADGVTLASAKAQLNAAGERFRKLFPNNMDKGESISVVPLRDAQVGEVRVALLILLGAVGFVLLIACANVANLLLVRAAARQRELAIRAAVGASRGRVARQLLTESIFLAALGAILGFAIGAWGVRALLLLVPGNIPRLTQQEGLHAALPLLDLRMVLFTVAVAAFTALLFGTLPALKATRTNIASHLKESSGRAGTGLRHNRVRSVLVVTEVALALVLLVGAALLIRTFQGLQNADTGLDPRNVLTLQTSLAGSHYTSTAQVEDLVTQTVARIEAVPGIETAASAIVLPVENGIDLPFTIVGNTPAKGQYEGDEQWRSISPHYFQAFKIPLLRGRVFAQSDAAASAHVVVINQAMAKRYWKNADPIGQSIVIAKGLGAVFEEPARLIVGIVGTVRENGLQNLDTGVMYVPQSQVTEGMTALGNSVIPLSWIVRTRGNPGNVSLQVQQAIRATDSQLPVSKIRTMQQVLAGAVARSQFNMLLLTIFAGIALVLAAIGIYGLMAYTVQQRTQEFGIRMALGASGAQLRTMMLGHGVRLAGLGVAVGLALAYALTRVLTSLLFGVTAADPLIFAGVAVILTVVALLAALIPASRATAVDPAIALRIE